MKNGEILTAPVGAVSSILAISVPTMDDVESLVLKGKLLGVARIEGHVLHAFGAGVVFEEGLDFDQSVQTDNGRVTVLFGDGDREGSGAASDVQTFSAVGDINVFCDAFGDDFGKLTLAVVGKYVVPVE